MACFRCDACGAEEMRMNDRGMIDEPTKCSNADCSEKFTMKVIHNRCHFFDKQVVKMQARGPAARSTSCLVRSLCKQGGAWGQQVRACTVAASWLHDADMLDARRRTRTRSRRARRRTT